MNHLKKTTCLLAVLLLSVVFAASAMADAGTALYSGKPAKYVFLFIGDGMGLPQTTAAEKYAGRKMVINAMPGQGITTTHAADRFITGSAASATALGCGQKTNIGMIGMTPDQKKVKSVAEIAKEMGWKVGIISSVSIDHATPAAFYAHVPSRSMYHHIDHALVDSGFDFFGGGGLKDPAGKRVLKADPKAETLGDAFAKAEEAGYKVIKNKADFMALKPGDGKVIAINEWLQDSGAMPYVMDMTEKDITLPELASKAIEMLDNDKGFFLMLEGGKIDWACHANDGVASILNTISFDDSVKVAVEFAKKHPEETLIVVTGDHECGGLTLGWAGTSYGSYYDILGAQKVSFQKFSDEIMAKYVKDCAGKCSFDDLKALITENFGLKFEGDSKKGPPGAEALSDRSPARPPICTPWPAPRSNPATRSPVSCMAVTIP